MPKDVQLHIPIQVYERFEELPESLQSLMRTAQEACNRAYAPYSHFHVGAALLLEDGTVVTGSNQENAAYPSGTCAERSAIFWTGANHPDKRIVQIAIAAYPEGAEYVPVSPCGACRQAMLEYEVRQGSAIPLLMQGENGSFIQMQTLSDLLPVKFDKGSLLGK